MLLRKKRKVIIMQLLVMVLNKVELLEELMAQLAAGGIGGATILNSTGMGRTLLNSDEEIPIFGMLRKVLSPEREESKTIFTVLKNEQLPTAKKIIETVTGGLNKPNTGIMFTIPVNFVEGLVK